MAKAVKKTTSIPKKKSARSGKNIERDNLAKELKTLIPKLDEEGLAFLVKQAQVHLYNMQVDALNKTLVKEEKRSKKTASRKKVSLAEEDFSEIKMSDTGSSYYIVFRNEWIVFSKNEMTTIVKIALSEGTELEIKERLFNWFSRERSDLLYIAAIANKFDNRLKSLINLLKENFKLKK
jgi:glyceraldehyde-3-phosphate dehydrogenase/erythrose-4-phosphate dehydrogenase